METGRELSYGVVPFRETERGLQFLLVQHNAGHWGFPKGLAEPGESPLQSAKRELREETGIEEVEFLRTRPFEQHYSFFRESQKIHKRATYYLARVDEAVSVVLQEEELQDFAWLTHEEAARRMTFAASSALFTRVLEALRERISRGEERREG